MKIIIFIVGSLLSCSLYGIKPEATPVKPDDKVVGAVLALRKKLTPNMPVEVIVHLADYILHDTENYTRHERLKIAFELLSDPHFKNYQHALIQHMYANPELAPRLPAAMPLPKKYIDETPLRIAEKFGYIESINPKKNLVPLLEPHDPLTFWGLRNSIILKEPIEEILKHFDVNTVDALGRSALHYAVKNNNIEAVKELLAKKANPNLKDTGGKTPLMLETNKEIVKELLEHGANPNSSDNHGFTPLMFAVAEGNPDKEIITMLLQAGADPRAKDRYGNTALVASNIINIPDIAIILLKAGADINGLDTYDNNIFTRAILNKKDTLLKLLYPYFDKLSEKNKEQVLIAALVMQNNTTVETLLIKGVNPNFTIIIPQDIEDLIKKFGISSTNTITPLMLAAAAGNTKALGNKELLRILLSHGADPLATDKNGKTARDYVDERLPNVRMFLQDAMDYAQSKKK